MTIQDLEAQGMKLTPQTSTPSNIPSSTPKLTIQDLQNKGMILTPQTSDTTQQPQKQPGFFQSLFQGIAKPFLRGGAGLIKTGQSLGGLGTAGLQFLQGNKQDANLVLQEVQREQRQPVDFGYLGKVYPYGNAPTFKQNLAETAGGGLQIASYLLGGEEAPAIARTGFSKGIGAALKAGLKQGALTGGVLGLGSSLEQQGEEGKFGLGRTAEDTAIGTALGAVFGSVFGIISGTSRLATQEGKQAFIKGLGTLSGYPENVVETAMKKTPGVKIGLKEGEPSLIDVVKNSVASIKKYAYNITKQYGKDLEDLAKKPSGPIVSSGKMQFSEGFEGVSNYIQRATNFLRNFRIGVTKDGELLFDRSKLPSNIVNASERKAIQEAFDTLKLLKPESDVKQVDAVLQKIRALQHYDTQAGTKVSAVIQGIYKEAERVTKEVYPDLAKIRANYSTAMDFIDQAKQLFGRKLGDGAKEIDQAVQNLYSLFNRAHLGRMSQAEAISQKIGQDIPGTVAGTLIKDTTPASIRAANLTKRGIIEKTLEAVPRATFKWFLNK